MTHNCPRCGCDPMINVAHPDGTPVSYRCPNCGYPQISEKQWREEYQNDPQGVYKKTSK